MAQMPTIDLLLNLVPERPNVVLEKLQAFPDLAPKQDAHGYSLVHAAASYGHADLLKALIDDFKVDPNIKDEDGETALFSVEEVSMAEELVRLGVDMNLPNDEGQTAAQKLDDEDEYPTVATYLRSVANGVSSTGDPALPGGEASLAHMDPSDAHPPPPLPQGLQLNLGTMAPGEAGDEPDPEFRRRIEELAARTDFDSDEAQRELRDLVTAAISGVNSEDHPPATSRRRLE